jgi:Metallo-beta-lactamase superfamily
MKAELWVFRVEQGLGNACALIFPDGSGAVIDWGTCRDEPLQELWRLLSRVSSPRLRFVAATHPHADHTLGLEQLLTRFHAHGAQIDRLVYPTPLGGPGENALKRARHRAKALRIPMSSVAVATLPGSPPAPVLAVGSSSPNEKWIVHVIAPVDTAIGNAEVQAERSGIIPGNPTSLVFQFGFERNQASLHRGRAILPGDATPATLNVARERSLQLAQLSLVNDALVIPHHGSSHNWVPWFDGMIRGIAVISAPSGRPKHPSETVLKEAVRI